MITVLTGGTGGAKFVDGLRRTLPPEDLTIIVNTGDDHQWWSLSVSPDIDSITYMLADLISVERGWGVRRDTFYCLQQMRKLGEPGWFSVGDRDLATHLLRTELLASGKTLTQATQEITTRLGVQARVLPMSDQKVETRIVTPAGEFSFQEYFVQRRFQDDVIDVRFEGGAAAQPAPGVIDAIAGADAVLIAPSNPVTSIGPILAVSGLLAALRETPAPVVAVSPIIGSAAVSGPAGVLMQAQGLQVSPAGIARAYVDFLDVLIADDADVAGALELENPKLQVRATNILMLSVDDRIRVAQATLEAAHCLKKGVPMAEAS